MEQEGIHFTIVTKRVKSKKPVPGRYVYKIALQYLVRVIDQDTPDYDFILSLASFATERELTEKQREKADEIIRYYIKKGILEGRSKDS